MSDTDLIKLYSQRILALAADVPHVGRLAAPQASVRKRSPLCGSAVTVDLVVADGRIVQYAQEVRACALGQAAAAVLGHVALGRTRAEIDAGRDALRAMLKNGAPPPAAPFDGYAALEPARDYKNRHASILLAIEATSEAMAAAEAKAG
jgi:NifU-like protein involved in Fe-S cluster formation